MIKTLKKEAFEKFIISRIKSFEKNPLKFGKPSRFKREIYMIIEEAGV